METCPICFENLDGKVRASPNTCDHVFCLTCIEKWAKHGSFCPVDRKRFKKIVNLDSENFIQVKPRKRKREKILYDFSAKCEVCFKGNHSDVLLLCDCCDLAFHLFCLKPALKKVPAGLWFCPTCISVESKLKRRNGVSKEVEADLGNATLQLVEIKKDSDIKKIPTNEKKQDSAKDSNHNESNLVQFNDTRPVTEQSSSIVKACINVASEFEAINVANKYCQDICSGSDLFRSTNTKKRENESSSKCLKNVKTCDKHGRKHKKYPSVQDGMCKIAELQSANIHDLCLENKTSKDDSLLEGCLCYYCKDIYSGGDHSRSTNTKKRKTESGSECLKNVKTYCKHKGKHKNSSSVQDTMCKSAEPQSANIEDLCLQNKTSKDDSLLEDCLSYAIIYGDMKIDIGEENYETRLDKSYTDMKHMQECRYKSSYDVKFRKNIHGISSSSHSHSIEGISNENCQQFSSNVNFSKQMMQDNAGHGGASSVNILPSCSSISAESDKGTFKNLLSDVCVESYCEGPGNEILEGKIVKGHLKEKEIQFSVFERIEGNDASQKKYSEINSRDCISFSPNLNIGHCFSCKDVMLAASQNYCKICKPQYMKHFIRNETNSKSTKSSNSSCIGSTSKKHPNFQYQGNKRGVKMSASERRQYSLLCKLQKIHKAQKKLIDTQK